MQAEKSANDLGDSSKNDAVNVESSKPGFWRRQFTSFDHTGAVLAVVFGFLSLTPTLLPRGPVFQGIVLGGSAAIGYLIGMFFAWLARFLISRDERWRQPARWWWSGFAVISAIGFVCMFIWYAYTQDQIRDLMGVEHLKWWAYPLTVVVAIIVFLIFMGIGRGWAAAVRGLTRLVTKVAPPRIAGGIAALLVVILTMFVLNGVVAKYSMKGLNSMFASINDETSPDTPQPTSSLRSGGPGSLVTWDSIGRQGRIFLSAGPTVEQLSGFNHRPATEPIRVFAGVNSADSLKASAELAADELERTGGFQRKLIAVGNTTGTGWINQATVDSLEYMYNGDMATVSMQYSFLPSWISFLVDQERARQAGQALFEAVDRRLRNIPEAQRPKIVVFGESLGSFGGESAFGSVSNIVARTNGALFIGPTFNNTMWEETTRNRDEGSPEWLPISDVGRHVRFVSEPTDLDRPNEPWDPARIVYLQHASDPITWWNPSLILHKPDWLNEERGTDVLPSTRWIPFVTFLQVSADMAVANSVPDGHGHTFLAGIPYSWAAILQPEGWTTADTQRLIPLLRRSS